MEELIKFRSLSDELNDNEYNQFIIQSIQSQGRNLFNTLIFNALKNTPEAIAPFTNIITNIVNSRESTPNIEISYDCLDTLPSVLIGECASFLESMEYFAFGTVNRKIYFSIYSPSKIHTFPGYLFSEHFQQIDMNKFKNIKNADIEITDFNELSTYNRSIWKTLHSFHSLVIINDADKQTMHQFFDQNRINFANVTNLHFTPNETMSFESFLKIISKFPMLEYLGLDGIDIDENENIASFNDDIIRMNLKKLKGFSTLYGDINLTVKLLNALSEQLEALSIDTYDTYGNVIVSNQKFPKLTELRLYGDDDANMKLFDLFKNVTSIKTACYQEWDQKELIQEFVKKMIEDQLCLEQLRIETLFENVVITLEAAESALIWTKHKKRESDQLFIEFTSLDELEKELMIKMYVATIRLMNALEMRKIENWRIKIKMFKNNKNNDTEKDEMKTWLNELEKLKDDYLIHYEITDFVTFIISNKACKICGYEQNSYLRF